MARTVTRRAAVAALVLPALAACRGPARTPGPARSPTPARMIGPDAAAFQIGQEVRVRMKVNCVDIGNRAEPAYLRPSCYYEGFLFRVAIPPEIVPVIEEQVRGQIEVRLLERVIDASGVVQQNGQWSEIVVTDPSQLRVATGLTPPEEPTRLPTPAPTATWTPSP